MENKNEGIMNNSINIFFFFLEALSSSKALHSYYLTGGLRCIADYLSCLELDRRRIFRVSSSLSSQTEPTTLGGENVEFDMLDPMIGTLTHVDLSILHGSIV